MKIILIASVAKLGKIGDIVEVKDGYAKNFLIPGNKAICFSENNAKIFEAKKQEFEKLNQDNLDNATKIREAVAKKDIIIIENASDDGRLYGSVSASTIANKINEIVKSDTVSRSNISLEKPIKEIGVYETKIELHSEAEFNVRVVVSRSEAEVESLLNPPKEEKAEEIQEKPAKKPRKTVEKTEEVAEEKEEAEEK